MLRISSPAKVRLKIKVRDPRAQRSNNSHD
jgi:hypothetical protein